MLNRRTFVRRLALGAVGLVAGVLTWPRRSQAGYGRCGVYGCNCQAYVGSSNTCGNCGHSYNDHW